MHDTDGLAARGVGGPIYARKTNLAKLNLAIYILNLIIYNLRWQRDNKLALTLEFFQLRSHSLLLLLFCVNSFFFTGFCVILSAAWSRDGRFHDDFDRMILVQSTVRTLVTLLRHYFKSWKLVNS